jgi:hypothetical protein
VGLRRLNAFGPTTCADQQATDASAIQYQHGGKRAKQRHAVQSRTTKKAAQYGPSARVINQTNKRQQMSYDDYYASEDFGKLVRARLLYDRYRCASSKCRKHVAAALFVVPLEHGGACSLENAVSLCEQHRAELGKAQRKGVAWPPAPRSDDAARRPIQRTSGVRRANAA